jgi:steroid 5-alpha reductase family enzyme
MSLGALVNTIQSSLQSTLHGVAKVAKCVTGYEGSVHGLSQCYYESDPLVVGYAICTGLIVYCFVWSVVGNNCSKVDQIWSIAPVIYCWHFYFHYAGVHLVTHYPLLLLCILVNLWGARLSYNFWKKGGYGTFFAHEEDYRWPILRAKMHPAVFLLFNFSFIAVYQNLLLYWITVPAYEVMKAPPVLTVWHVLMGVAFAALLVMETLADEQHWVFQQTKYSLTRQQRESHTDPDIRQGFFRSGLFKYCRHPNYFAEQCMWVCVYLFSLAYDHTDSGASHPYLNWTCLGCIQLILLFQGSMTFGESITLSKYPAYAEYQKTTSRCIPLPPGRRKAELKSD